MGIGEPLVAVPVVLVVENVPARGAPVFESEALGPPETIVSFTPPAPPPLFEPDDDPFEDTPVDNGVLAELVEYMTVE